VRDAGRRGGGRAAPLRGRSWSFEFAPRPLVPPARRRRHRTPAALENGHLLEVVNKCIAKTDRIDDAGGVLTPAAAAVAAVL
jgi:hypothetical protein